MASKSYSVTLHVEVSDGREVIRLARARMRAEGVKLGRIDTADALRYLLDPGYFCDGASILDSDVEHFEHRA